MAFSLSQPNQQVLERLLARYPEPRAACVPLLHLCQAQDGWVSPEAIQFVAERLGMTTGQVEGVVTFYSRLHQRPVAPHVIWVCRTLSCELRGAKAVQEHLEARLGCRVGQDTRDGRFSLRKTECLAACGDAPVVQIDDAYHEKMTLERLDALLDALAAESAEPSEDDAASSRS